MAAGQLCGCKATATAWLPLIRVRVGKPNKDVPQSVKPDSDSNIELKDVPLESSLDKALKVNNYNPNSLNTITNNPIVLKLGLKETIDWAKDFSFPNKESGNIYKYRFIFNTGVLVYIITNKT